MTSSNDEDQNNDNLSTDDEAIYQEALKILGHHN